MPKRHPSILPLTLVLSALFCAQDALACAACGCTLSKDWETQGLSTKPGFTLDVSLDTLNQNQQRYGSGAASPALINSQLAAGQEVEAYTRTRTVTASLIYNDDAWGLSAHIPYVARDHGTWGNTDPLGSSYSESSENGIGDIRLMGRYAGFFPERNIGLLFGVKLPTGGTGANFTTGTSAGQPLDAGLQIGTGSTDLIAGAYFTGAIGSFGWFVQGTVQHAVAQKKALGDLDYRPGDAYAFNAGIRYAAYGARLSPMLQLNVIKRQADSGLFTVPTDPLTGVPVSGGTLAYLAPGLAVRLGGGTSIYGFAQWPVYQRVNSLQLTPSHTLTLGVRHTFE